MDELTIRMMAWKLRTYDDLTKTIVSSKNRLHAMNPEARETIIDDLEKAKGRLVRQIEKDVMLWPIWREWLANVPGIGPFIAGNLILLYYYRFVPICTDCGHDLERENKEEDKGSYVCAGCGKIAKGEGVLQTRIEEKDFANISKWWAYLGIHTVDGRKPKKSKGARMNWSARGRQICYQIGESFVKRQADHPYKAFYLERKQFRMGTHPDGSQAHRHNMAKNETVKVFQAHFWTVARTIDGKTVTEPYVGRLGGTHNVTRPFYWQERESEETCETRSRSASGEIFETKIDAANRPATPVTIH